MMVVPVLITNCQVSEKSKRGPKKAQTTITKRQLEKRMACLWLWLPFLSTARIAELSLVYFWSLRPFLW
jgi:hypothetical protein